MSNNAPPSPNPELERLALYRLTAECNACLDRLSRFDDAALRARERGDLDRVRALLHGIAAEAEERRAALAAAERGPAGPAVRRPR